MLPTLDTAYFGNVTTKLYILFMVIHAMFIPLFYFSNVQELFIFNGFSVICYSLVLWLNKRNKIILAFSFATAEIIAHAYLCSILIGDAGFSDAILVLPVIFFVSFYKLSTKIIFFISVILIYLFLIFNEQLTTPVYDFNSTALGYFEILSSILIVVIDSYVAYYAFNTLKKNRM